MKRMLSAILSAAILTVGICGAAVAENGRGTRNGGQNGRGGGQATETDEVVINALADAADKFEQLTYTDEATGITLAYSLYIPENMEADTKYPLVMYIPDSTGAGKSAEQIVQSYYGAVAWVGDEDQAKHPSFVLVPAFSEVVVNDSFNTSAQIDVAVRLIQQLMQDYAIDEQHIYTTGQSMGAMTSLYLSSQYPDLFAAYLFVSGQWDVSVLQGLEAQTFFYIVVGGDAKASAGQTEVMQMFDADGVSYAFGTWNAQNSADDQNAAVQAMLAENQSANFIRFETGSVLAGGSGSEHMASFSYAYKISAVRDWLFEQSK